MADYNANIKVNADTRAAEQALKRLTTEFDKLKGVKNIGEAFVPKQALTRLERSLTTVVNRANTVEKAFARVVEGVATLGVSGAALGGLNEALKGVATATGQSAANFSGAARKVDEFAAAGDTLKTTLAQVNNLLVDVGHEIARGIVPGFSVMDDTAQATAQTANKLQYALQQFLDSSEGIRTFVNNIGTLEGTSGAAAVALTALAAVVEGQLSEALYDIDTSASTALQNLAADASKGASELQRLIRATQGTVEQYEALISKGQERIRTVNAESDEARRAANTITQGQKLLNAELERQNDLLREARGLRPASEEKRATDRYNLFQRRKEYTKTVADEFTAVDESIARIAQQPTDWSRALGIDTAEEKLRRFNEEMDALHQALGQMEGRAVNPFGITAEQIELAEHNAKEFKQQIQQVNLQLEDLTQLHKTLGQMEKGGSGPFGIEEEQIQEAYEYRFKEEKAFEDLRLDTIRQAIKAELDGIDEVYNARTRANKAALADFDRRLKGRGEAKKRRREITENVIIGGAFPMLFGGGPGAVLGGAAGGFIPGNPMLSVATSALGALLDQFTTSVTEMGASLNDPITNFQKLAEAGLIASRSQKRYIERLIEAGRITEATTLIQEELIQKIGVKGVKDIQNAGAASDKLSKALAELSLQAQAAVAGPLAGILSWLSSVISIGNRVTAQAARQTDIMAGLSPNDRETLRRREQEILRGANIFNEAEKRQQVQALYQSYASKATIQTPGTAVDLTAEQQAQAVTKELAAQVQLEGQKLTLAGMSLEKDGMSFIAVSKRVAQQEYDNRLLEIRNYWIGKAFDAEKNQLMIRQANLQLAAKLRQLDAQAAQAAERANEERIRAYQQALQLQNQLAQTVLDEYRIFEQGINLYKGVISGYEQSLILLERRFAIQEGIIRNEYASAQASKEYATNQVTIDATFKNRLNNLRLEKDYLLSNLDVQRERALLEQQLTTQRIKNQNAQRRVAGQTEIDRLLTQLEAPFGGEQLNRDMQLLDQYTRRMSELAPLEEKINELQASITAAEKTPGVLSQDQINAAKAELVLQQDQLEQLQMELQLRDKLEQQLLRQQELYAKYGFIADEVSRALSDSITGLITGTTTVTEAFSRMFENISKAFIDMATQMLAQQIFMTVLKALGGGGSFGAVDSQGRSFGMLVDAFADGGFVTGPTRAIIGEGGEPEYVIPASKMPGALARYASGMRGSGVIDGAVSDNRDFLNSLTTGINDSTVDVSESQDAVAATRASLRETERLRENRMQIMSQQSASERRYERERIEQMASTPGNLNIKYESQVINNVEYVTRDQAERMAAQSAIRGRELALSSLQNSVKARKRVGMA